MDQKIYILDVISVCRESGLKKHMINNKNTFYTSVSFYTYVF